MLTLKYPIMVKQKSAYGGGEDIVAPSHYPCTCGRKKNKTGSKKNRAHQLSNDVFQVCKAVDVPVVLLQMATGVQLNVHRQFSRSFRSLIALGIMNGRDGVEEWRLGNGKVGAG